MNGTFDDVQSRVWSAGGDAQMANGYQIHINFLSVAGELPDFTVYRKLRAAPQESRPSPETMAYRLPLTPDAKDYWPSYLGFVQQRPGLRVV